MKKQINHSNQSGTDIWDEKITLFETNILPKKSHAISCYTMRLSRHENFPIEQKYLTRNSLFAPSILFSRYTSDVRATLDEYSNSIRINEMLEKKEKTQN